MFGVAGPAEAVEGGGHQDEGGEGKDFEPEKRMGDPGLPEEFPVFGAVALWAESAFGKDAVEQVDDEGAPEDFGEGFAAKGGIGNFAAALGPAGKETEGGVANVGAFANDLIFRNVDRLIALCERGQERKMREHGFDIIVSAPNDSRIKQGGAEDHGGNERVRKEIRMIERKVPDGA